MFELTLCMALERQKYLSEFYKQISPSIKQGVGVITKQNIGEKSYLIIGVDSLQKEYLKSKVLDFISMVIIKEFKLNFLKSKINVQYQDKLTKAFLGAITNFDSEIDREIISQNIEFCGEIVVESFYYFKLQSLQDRWQKTAKIINNNLIMSNNVAILEVLRYLCATSNNSVSYINITFITDKIVLKYLNKSKKFSKDFDGLSNLYEEVIKLNPMKINIVDDENKMAEFGEVTSILSKVFYDKVYFV